MDLGKTCSIAVSAQLQPLVGLPGSACKDYGQ
jgi:hypothetical protein